MVPILRRWEGTGIREHLFCFEVRDMRCRLANDESVADQVLRQLLGSLQKLVVIHCPQAAEHAFTAEVSLSRLFKE